MAGGCSLTVVRSWYAFRDCGHAPDRKPYADIQADPSLALRVYHHPFAYGVGSKR